MDLVQQFYQLNDNADTLEVCLVLFKQCNLKCAFCFQDHNGIDRQYIEAIPANIQQQYLQLFSRRKFKKILYRVWGGELFADDIDDSMFSMYEDLVISLKNIGDKLGMQTQICFSSNLVFTKTERVKKLLNDADALLATSYDPLYRFHDESQLNVWRRNAAMFKPHTVSITLTKQNIHAFIDDKKHFEILKPYSLSIEYYIYSKMFQFFKPSEEDLFQFFKYCVDNGISNIPEVNMVVKSYQNPVGRYCTCNNSCLYIDGKLTFNCLKRSSDLPIDQFFDCIPDEEHYTEVQMKTAVSRKGCLACQNYSFCRMSCLASMLHKSYDIDNCCFSKIYKYIGQRNGQQNTSNQRNS